DLYVLHGPQMHFDVEEGGRGERAEFLGENTFGFLGLVDVDVVPFAFAELGQVLDEGGLPVQADAHERQVDLFLVGALGQLAAFVFAGGFAVGENEDLREASGAGRFLDLVEGQAHAVVHGRAARIDVEHVDLVDDFLDLGFLGDGRGGQQHEG